MKTLVIRITACPDNINELADEIRDTVYRGFLGVLDDHRIHPQESDVFMHAEEEL